MAHYRRLEPVTTRSQLDLGLEILARQRLRPDYLGLFAENIRLLGGTRPDFVHLNESVRIFASSVVWIQQPRGTGSGFAVGPNEVATNRHVVTNDSTGKLVSPGEVRVVSRQGLYRVASIHVPSGGHDDVAILRLEEPTQLLPLNLGFSELVEVGERILTLGFPSPGTGGFEENLYCNTGLVNRIRPSELCSERVLEVSLELQGGISGAPILNELGEVVGLVTFAQFRAPANQVGQMHVERSFYAIPVEVLRRLRAEIP
jgi:molecular chaperone DnaK